MCDGASLMYSVPQPEYVKVLSDVLHHGSNSTVARMAAGIQLKNTLASNDAKVKVEYQHRWLAFPADTRTYIKNNVSFSSCIGNV